MPPELVASTGRATRWPHVATLVWSIALVLLCGKALLWPHRHSVYPIFARAGQTWLQSGDLYATTPGHEPYRYSPLVAAFFAPLSLLPDGPAGVLWLGLSATVFLGGLAWWSRAALPLPLTRAHRALLFLLVAPLALGNVHNGQANLLIIGLLLVAAAAVAVDRPNLAAICIAAACIFKVYPIALGLLLVALEPRRLGPRLGLALAAGLALPFLLQRPEYVAGQYASWFEHLSRNDRQLLEPLCWYRDARLLCSRWVAPMSYTAYQATELLSGCLIALACLRARRQSLAKARLLALGLACCWMTALGPATESATYVLLGPIAAWLLVSAAREDHPFGLRVTWITSYVLLVGSQAVSMLPAGWGRTIQALGPQPLAGLLLLAGLLYLASRSASSETRKPETAKARIGVGEMSFSGFRGFGLSWPLF
jgi:hypothetical protein